MANSMNLDLNISGLYMGNGSHAPIDDLLAMLIPRKYDTYCKDRACHILYGDLMPAVASFGLVGNILSTAVLMSLLRRSNSIALICLTVLDTVLLLVTNAVYLTMAYCEHFSPFCNFMVTSIPRLYPVSLVARTSSILVCVVISLERCYVVTRPLNVQLYFSKRKSLIQSLLCVGIAGLYNIPAFFELEFDPMCQCLRQTPMRSNKSYLLYYRGILSTLLDFAIPFVVISVANFITLAQLRKSTTHRKEMTYGRLEPRQHRLSREFTVASCLIVLVFVVAQIFPLINHLMEVMAESEVLSSGLVVLFVYIGNVSVAFGSAVNILIYSVSGSKFRLQFYRLFCCRIMSRKTSTTAVPKRSETCGYGGCPNQTTSLL